MLVFFIVLIITIGQLKMIAGVGTDKTKQMEQSFKNIEQVFHERYPRKTEYQRLIERNLFEELSHGKTQNQAFNGPIWKRIPKETVINAFIR